MSITPKWVTLFALVIASLGAANEAPPPHVDQARAASLRERLPLSFEPNLGQFGQGPSFGARGVDGTVGLFPDGFGLVVQGHPVRARFLGAKPSSLRPTAALPGVVSYFVGSDRSQWKSGLRTYARVEQHRTYPGIDVAYYGTAGHLEYDWLLAPGADPSKIRISIEGAAGVKLDSNGDLVLRVGGGEIRQRKPSLYQVVNDSHRPIAGGYQLNDDGKTVSFQVAPHDSKLPLVIDPGFGYATFLGGTGNDQLNGMAVDSSGNVYLAGYSTSTNFPTTTGAYLSSNSAGATMVFVSKLNSSGSALAYSTYLGGGGATDSSFGYAIAVDGSGNAYVTGSASSSFPLVNPAQATGNGFIAKLNPTGTALVYSTLFGGGTETGYAIALDGLGNAYVGGYTGSTTFPTSSTAYQRTLGGGYDGFIVKLNASGSTFLYSTYFGGNGNDEVDGIAVDSSGNAFVTGYTYSTSLSFPPTPGAFQVQQSSPDVFIGKLNPSGSAVVYLTMLGGNGSDTGAAIAVDSSGNAYVVGQTYSTNFPHVGTPYSNPGTYCSDAFITEMNPTGTAAVFSTQIGGNNCTVAHAVALDAAGNIHVVGQTQATNFPTSASPALAAPTAGASDGFLLELSPGGASLLYSTYLGAFATAVGVDSAGNQYAAGFTSNTSFGATSGAIQTARAGTANNDGFLAVVAVAPTLSGISPASGTTNGGTAVTVGGTGFRAGATLTIGGTAAGSVRATSSSTITANTPAHAAGAADVVVTNPDGQTITLTGAYTYYPPPAPTSISPATGTDNGLTPVTISGSGFATGATVLIGGQAATSVTVVSASSITARTPIHPAATVNVQVINPDGQTGTLANGFTYTAAPAPTLSAVAPTSGSSNGATSVTLTGTGFATGATVSFGGSSARSVTVTSSTSMTALTPSHSAGAVNVVVTNPDGLGVTLTGGYTYNTAPAPTLTSVSPATGRTNQSTPVTLTGTGFAGGATVTIGGAAATSVTVVSATSITCTAPPHLPAAAVSVVVTNPDGQSVTLSNGFTYVLPPPPTVTSISPTSGVSTGGAPVTITGTGYYSGATVRIGGNSATSVVVVSATSITAVTPSHAVGTADVTVTNADGQSATLTGGFTYNPPPPPTVTSISPTSGGSNGHTAVTVTGTGYLSGATLTIGGVAATGVTVASATQITATTGAHSAGAVDVVVTNPDNQTGTLTGGYTYNASPAPTVSGISPSSGTSNGSTAVTITGTGFDSAATLTIGGTTPTSITVLSGTTITATTVAHAAGAVDVVVTNPDGQAGTKTGAFTYVAAPPPTLSSISPTSGDPAGGTSVTVNGTGFAAGLNITFGGQKGLVAMVSQTTLYVSTPAHSAGAVDVVVTNPDGQAATLAGAYTFSAAAVPSVSISQVNPSSGSQNGGTAVTLTGTLFAPGAKVTFGGTAATNIRVVSANSITATTPAHAVGAADVVVTNSDGTSATLPGGFTYLKDSATGCGCASPPTLPSALSLALLLGLAGRRRRHRSTWPAGL